MKSIRQRIAAITFALFGAMLAISPVHAQSSDGYTSLIDGVSLNGWNHHRVPDDVHCCSRCWSSVPVAERLKYQIMLDDRAPDGPIGNLASLARGAIMRDDSPQESQ